MFAKAKLLPRSDVKVVVNKEKELVTQPGGKLILMSHMGRPKGKRVAELSLEPCVAVLDTLLGKKVGFVDDCIGQTVEARIESLNEGDILLLQNLRYYRQETENDPDFAAQKTPQPIHFGGEN